MLFSLSLLDLQPSENAIVLFRASGTVSRSASLRGWHFKIFAIGGYDSTICIINNQSGEECHQSPLFTIAHYSHREGHDYGTENKKLFHANQSSKRFMIYSFLKKAFYARTRNVLKH